MLKPAFIFDGRRVLDHLHPHLQNIGFQVSRLETHLSYTHIYFSYKSVDEPTATRTICRSASVILLLYLSTDRDDRQEGDSHENPLHPGSCLSSHQCHRTSHQESQSLNLISPHQSHTHTHSSLSLFIVGECQWMPTAWGWARVLVWVYFLTICTGTSIIKYYC